MGSVFPIPIFLDKELRWKWGWGINCWGCSKPLSLEVVSDEQLQFSKGSVEFWLACNPTLTGFLLPLFLFLFAYC